MRLLAKWHIWLGWLVGVPILMWTLTGLLMVAKPIEEVRGNHLRVEAADQPLVIPGSAFADQADSIKEIRAFTQDGRAIALLTDMEGNQSRVDFQTGEALPPLTANDASALVAKQIVGGDKVRTVALFQADDVPFDFRRPMPVWQVALEDGAHIYVGQQTGRIEAVRTSWWRAFDFAWGLHIMDLKTREDTSHPILITFAALSAFGALMGCVLMFRRRKAKAAART
ncbi:MAG: PepSY domain-containing protein [Erythrobacter sp.]